MFVKLLSRIAEKNFPRGFVLFLDLFLCFFSFVFSYSLQVNIWNGDSGLSSMAYPLIFVLIFRLQAFLFTRSYTGIIKYTSTQDGIRLSWAIVLSTSAIWLVSYFYWFYTGNIFIRLSVVVMDACLSMVLLVSLRLGTKMLYKEIAVGKNSAKRNIVIYGADETGMLLKRTLENDHFQKIKVVAFIDDNRKLAGKSADGCPIFQSIDSLDEINKKNQIDELILAVPKINSRKKKFILEKALEYRILLKSIPPIENWINGELSTKQLKPIEIEDLLSRDPILLDKENIGYAMNDKIILVTGAAGSIGSEIVRQCLQFSPKQIIMLDQAESPLHELTLELNANKKIIPVIADIRNKDRLKSIFEKYQPQIVFHAAAYKHVPLMEANPYEAIQTNVFGTKIVADLAVSNRVDKFIYISTDKAVNPSNIMGASKRISEIYIQSLNAKLELTHATHTRFITTRFGNVLGSNGSVIPRFSKQIESGGPVTVTHPEINRFFMTIPEACQLVLEAGSMGNGGEIYIFDMGEPVRIYDLAEKMIRLSGLTPYKDIDIIFTGLRPGEKLKEELLNDKENTIGTHHPKIMIAKVAEYNFLEINETINSMNEANTLDKSRLLVAIMKQIVPEYISNNSIYESLDKSINSAN